MADVKGVTPDYIIQRCDSLEKNWSTRKKKFKEWYDIILLTDELEQEGMESVATNDPRTSYNLAKHLLTTMSVADKIPTDTLAPEFIPATSYLETFIDKRWIDQEKRYRRIGRQGWLDELVGWLLVTGWYSVFSMVTSKSIWAEVWSPAECFPDFGPDGLVEHAHIYTLSAAAANKKIRQMGWSTSRPFTDGTKVYDHWTFDADGDVANGVVMGSQFVKAPVKDPYMSKLGVLPIFTSPAGGLPDRGSITGKGEWQKHSGESLVATNEDLNANYNRMRTFYQQAARQSAQHHWLELSSGETNIATDALMDRWGSVLHGAPGEDVRAIQPPAMPVELTSVLMTYRNELERGLFPAAVFGNVQQQMSYLAMANAAAASMQTLTPYLQAIRGMRTDVDNFWSDMLIKVGFSPHGFKKPDNIPEPEDRLFDIDANVDIPGYLIQRATVARMLNPEFTLPEAWLMDKMFPEIKNPLLSQAQVRKERAMRHPKAILVDQIIAYKEQARLLRDANNVEFAGLYEKLAKSLEAELEVPAQPGGSQPTLPTIESPLTREVSQSAEDLGRV